MPRLLVCTDMDRTVIPNGAQPEDPQAHRSFKAFCANEAVTLVYVTGRHQALVQEAIIEYGLPEPDFVITDVGTKIYNVTGHGWQVLESWEAAIDKDWHGKDHTQIKQLLSAISDLKLQEPEKQNTHKLSYYLPLHMDHALVMDRMETLLNAEGIDASLIWSVDEPENIGLLDVLPRNATKVHAIEFLRDLLGYKLEEMVFAGDSGNDLPVLTSRIHSVLVANASSDVKETAQHIVAHNGYANALYLADQDILGMNGNYSAGILQGIWHFAPAFRHLLEETGVRA